MASLSGYVYLDYNGSSTKDTGDYAIRNARITLSRSDDPSYQVVTTAGKDGFYSFENLQPLTTGTYSLTLDHYTCVDGTDNLGVLYNANGTLVANTALYGTAHNTPNDPAGDSFTGITLQAGFKGVNYNFGEKEYPLELLTKRFYMDWGTPPTVTPPSNPVPEPASIGLLAFGMLTLGLVRLRRR